MKRVITIGGGTGSYIVLSGLKDLPNISLTALVSMADDGGSTGILREKRGVMPPGDVRQCLVALSGKEFLNRKFTKGYLKEHKIGNIFLSVLEKITGNFTWGLKILSWLFGVKGKIIPITLDKAVLSVILKDSVKITGESKIEGKRVEKIFYEGNVYLNKAARKPILEADFLIICPGSFYTSIVPNLIVDGFREILAKSNATIIAIANLDDRDTNEYINKLELYLEKPVNILLPPDQSLSAVNSMRHDPKKLAKHINDIINAK